MPVANIYRTSAFGPAIPPRLTSGGFALFANGTGTASFDHLYVSQYPDPSLSLSSVGRAANSLVNWNALLPTGTSLTVQTSVDNGVTWSSVAAAGDAIANISLAPDPTVDTFASDTSANYTNTHGTGGSSAVLTWDTANSRLKAVGGSKAAVLVNGLSVTDVDMFTDIWLSDNGGLIWRWIDASNYYELIVMDSAASSPNTMKINKYVAGTLTALASSTGTFTFPTQTHHYVRMTMLGSVITAYFDGIPIISVTDTSLTSGSCGLRNDTGTSYFYNLYIQPQGQDLSGSLPYQNRLDTLLTLNSTNPTVTPQITDLEAFVGAASFGTGDLVPNANYNDANSYISSDVDDLKTKSNGYWWSISNIPDANGIYNVTFQARDATPAPFPLDEANSTTIAGQAVGDILLNGISVSYNADLYRNQQKIKNAIATANYDQIFTGDGQSRTWNVANPLAAPPASWTLNNQPVSFGITGVDSGKDFYYQIGSTALTQDSGGTILEETDSFEIAYIGSSLQDVVYTNTSLPGTLTQPMLAAIAHDSGIVENIIDVAGENMSTDTALAYAQQLCQEYGVAGLTLPFTTLHPGLAIGQQLAIYAPDLNINDVQAFVTGVAVSEQLAPGVSGGILYGYAITVQTGPALPAGSWIKQLAAGLSS